MFSRQPGRTVALFQNGFSQETHMNPNPTRRRLVGAMALAALPLPTLAQTDFPSKPIRIVVPFPAGGSLDNLGRVLAAKMTESLGHSVVIDPRAGGATIIGTQIVQKAPPDGYTLLFMANSFLLTPMLMQKAPPWDPLKDFVPVSLLARVNQVLVAHPSFGPRSIKELVTAAKAAPGSINFASFGNGTSSHLGVELFKKEAGIDMTHVPYKGVAPALQDVLGGQVKLFLTNFPEVLPHIQAGRLRALGVADDKRLAQLPDVPTFAEQGFPGFLVYSWYGCVAPAGTPDAAVKKLHTAFAQALSAPDMIDRLTKQGMVILNSPGEELRRFMLSEQKLYAEPVRLSGAKID
jgi:tripartite-type tricarboxylate transporter receptor subunit TctC